MYFVKRHWLGIAVLVSFAWSAVFMWQHPHDWLNPPAVLFDLFLAVWLFRGFIRFVGRAWHHSTSERHN